MRSLFLNVFFLCGMFLLWYSHAPEDHKNMLPPQSKQAVDALDRIAAASVQRISTWADLIATAKNLEGHQQLGPLVHGERQSATRLQQTASTDPAHQDTTYAGISMENAVLTETRLDWRNLDHTRFDNAAFAQVTLHRATGEQTRFEKALLYRTDFSYAQLRAPVFTDAILADTVFQRADVTRGNFSRAIIRGGIFRDADMTGSVFDNTRFELTDLQDADLSATSFRGAVFDNTRLHGASLTVADLSGADLRTARGLTQSQLDRACGNVATRLPEGMSISSCEPPAATRLAQIAP